MSKHWNRCERLGREVPGGSAIHYAKAAHKAQLKPHQLKILIDEGLVLGQWLDSGLYVSRWVIPDLRGAWISYKQKKGEFH